MISNEVASGGENRHLQVNRQARIEEYNTGIIEQHFLERNQSGWVEVMIGTCSSSGFEGVCL
jgi:hypothetical protein